MTTNENPLSDETRKEPEVQSTNNQSVGAAANRVKQSDETNPAIAKGLGKKLAVAMAGVAGFGAGAAFSSFMPASESTGEATAPTGETTPANTTETTAPVSVSQHSGGQTPAVEPEPDDVPDEPDDVPEGPDDVPDGPDDVPDEPDVIPPVVAVEIHIGTPSQVEIDGVLYNILPVYSGENHELHSAFIDTDGDGLYNAVVDPDGNLYASADFSFGEIVKEFEGTSLENYEYNTSSELLLPREEDVVAPFEVRHGNMGGYDVAYVPAVVDGQEAVFIDGVHTDDNGDFVPEDADGVFDVVVVEDNVYDIHEEGITLDNIQQHIDSVSGFDPVDDVQYPDNSIDFDNNADVNNFI